MTPSKIIHQRVPLSPDDLAELDRRKSNAAANRAIMVLRDELKGLKLAMDVLHGFEGEETAFHILKIERNNRLHAIKALEASKCKRGEGGT
jgi:hypothetical protein